MDRDIKIDGTAPKWPSCFEAFAHSTTHPLRRLGFVDPAHRLDPLGILVEILRNDENFKKWKWKPRTPTFTRSMELRRRVSCINKCKRSPEVQSACVYVTKLFRPMFFCPCHFFSGITQKKNNLQSRREHSLQNQQVPLPGQLLPCRVAHTLHQQCWKWSACWF